MHFAWQKTTYATYDQFGSPSLLLVVLGNEVAFHFTKAEIARNSWP